MSDEVVFVFVACLVYICYYLFCVIVFYYLLLLSTIFNTGRGAINWIK